MPSFRAVAVSRRKNGEWPIYIRMVHGRKSRLLPTGLVATDGDLHGKELRDSLLIDKTDALMKRMRDNCNAYGGDITQLGIDVVARIAQRRSDFDRNFFSYADRLIARLKAEGSEGTARAKATAVNSLRAFVGRDVLHYEEMTVRLLSDWKERLRAEGRQMSKNYVTHVASIYRSACKDLNDEDEGVVRVKNDPFRKVKPDRTPDTRKRALDPYDIVRISEADLKGGSMASLARDVFMISFYLIGMNGADLYEARQPIGGRLEYNRRKTRGRRTDGAFMSIRLEDELAPYIERHKGTDGVHLFDFSEKFLTANAFVVALSHGMASLRGILGIEGLTLYSARHSWATYAVNECGVDIYTVDKALCHHNAEHAMTEVYVKKSFADVDKANRRVIDFVEEAGL